MKPVVSVVVPYRDRDLKRIENLFQSLVSNTSCEIEFIVSDYGSQESYRQALGESSLRLGFRTVRSETQGLPWNRSHAINNGVRKSEGEWIVVVDADMVFHDGVIDHLVRTIKTDEVWLLESFWPQSKKQKPLKGLRHRSQGVFHMVHRSWFDRLSGFCEDFEFWGAEDTDWVRRLESAGCQAHWLTADEYHLTHTWHPQENNPVSRPFTAVNEAIEIEVRNGVIPYQNSHWGTLVSLSERPVLAALDRAELVTVAGRPQNEWIPRAQKALNSGLAVTFDLGPRITPRALTRWVAVPLAFGGLLDKFSLRIEKVVNGPLETLLLFRKVLGKDRLDVYLGSDLETITLMRK